jgi:hypothetical protein
MMQRNSLALIIPAFLALLAPGLATARDDGMAKEEEIVNVERGEELLITLNAPLTSPLFSETPVAVVDEEPITFRDLMKRIGSIHQEVDKGATPTKKKDYADLLDRVITTKLIVHEARNIGLDELPEVVENIETMSADLLISEVMSRKLAEVEPDPDDVSELYEMMSRELLMATVNLQKEEDALSFKEQVDSGEDFEVVAKRFSEEGKAEFDTGDGQYIKLKDMRQRFAQAVINEKAGFVGEIFADAGVFTVFHIEAVRSYEDPALKEEARQKALEPAQREAAREYAEALKKKHSTVDERLLKKVDFDSKKTGFLSLGKKEPADFDELVKDDRVVATVHVDPPFTVTIADLATAVQKAFFHGVETAAKRKKDLNNEKQVALNNMLFTQTVVAEARSLGLDQTDTYLDQVNEFSTSLLFNVFVKKVIAPDVKITQEEVREYFDANVDEFSTPKMFRLNAIVFSELPDAERSLRKIEKRADFKWVSANSPGRVDEENQEGFDFDGALLSVTALPEDLHERIEDFEQGDALIYSDAKGYHHVLVVSKTFPPKPRPYESVKTSIAKTIYDQNLMLLITDWSDKLKEAYETRIFVEGLGD